jgi:glycosyltransferase involved in cell wall biosynthesis
MKILIVHNYYINRGGEDSVFESEFKQLKSRDDLDIFKCTIDSKNYNSFLKKILVGVQIPFSLYGFIFISLKILKYRPDIAHVHNFFPILSPSIFWAFKLFRIPVIHTLHNFRIICPSSTLFYKHKVILKSLTHGPLWALFKPVYRQSKLVTLMLIVMICLNKIIGTWNNNFIKFICLTKFQMNIFIKFGIKKDKIYIKGNNLFRKNLLIKSLNKTKKSYAIFVGKGSNEKGFINLLNLWDRINYNLIIIGDIPNTYINRIKSNPNIKYLGKKNYDLTLKYISAADFLVFPSIWYEGFPMVLVEAMSFGVPSIVNNIGSMPEIIIDRINGIVVQQPKIEFWEQVINELINNKLALHLLSNKTKAFYKNNYSDKKNIDNYYNILTKTLACKK